MSSEKEKLIQTEDTSETIPINTNSRMSFRQFTIFPMIFLYCAGEEMLNYVINEWIQYKMRVDNFPGVKKLTGNFSSCAITNHSDPNYNRYITVQQETASWMLYYKLGYLVPSFLVLLFIPSYSDMYGRKFIFVLVASAALLKHIIVAITIYSNLSPLYIVFAHVLYGLTGSSSSIMSAVFSSVADITIDGNKRVIQIVIIEIVTIFSSLSAAILSGYFIETTQLGFSTTAFICVATVFLAYLITIVCVPETLTNDKRVKPKPFLETMKRTVEIYTSKEFKTLRASYILLSMSFFVGEIADTNRNSLEVLYFLGQPFCWGPQKISYFSFAQSASKGVIGLGSIKLLQKCFSNEAIAVVSTISAILGLVIEAFASSDILIYMVPVASILSLLIFPMIRGIMSTMTPTDRQGSMFASISAVAVLGTLIGVPVGNEIYSATLYFMNGFVFLILAFFFFVDFILILTNYCIKPKTEFIQTVSGDEK